MQNNRVKKFINDLDTQEAVRQFILAHYLKSNKNTDVNYLAAKMIAVELLNSAWKEMQKEAYTREIPDTSGSQVGL